jgi:glutamine synthetase
MKEHSSILLTKEEFEELASAKEIDTVICAAPDPYGRLVGKRLTIDGFRALGLDGEGINASGIIFGFDIELNPLELKIANADNGYRDIRLVPDLKTMRRVPWEQNAVLVMCDAFETESETMVAVAPRTILKQQISRAREMDLSFKFASELEFFVAAVSNADARKAEYRNLTMLCDDRADYQLMQSARDEWFIHQLRSQLTAFGVPIEAHKPEWGPSQQELTLDYCETLEMADRHVLFKYGVKELARMSDLTVTFMAKPRIDEVGSSGHMHVSLWDGAGTMPLGWSADPSGGMSSVFGSFVAGQLQYAIELGLMFAPTINSYKRFKTNAFAGTAVALGDDNRSCAMRLVGNGPSYRLEHRIPGADVNPYYAFSAVIAGGLRGIEDKRPIPSIHVGNAELENGTRGIRRRRL